MKINYNFTSIEIDTHQKTITLKCTHYEVLMKKHEEVELTLGDGAIEATGVVRRKKNGATEDYLCVDEITIDIHLLGKLLEKMLP